ncbi:MAG TPA: hypothetical protein VJT32_14500 [bacterium]|nr:hypothetical protein [bacterium]
MRGRSTRRAAEARIATTADRPGIEPWLFPRGTPLPRAAARTGPNTLWKRLQDDRELVGLKIVLLTALLIMTAFLELVA